MLQKYNVEEDPTDPAAPQLYPPLSLPLQLDELDKEHEELDELNLELDELDLELDYN